ncbi:MAG: hypothetical protein WC184_11600 [Acidimicrobiia bacterium]
MLHASPNANNYLAVIHSDNNSGRIQLTKTINGTRTLLADKTGIGRPNTTTMKVVSYNQTITIWMDNTHILTHHLNNTDTNLFKPNTRHGIITDKDNLTYYTHFTVTQI